MANIPYTDYDRNILERISWRLYDLEQLHPTVTGGPAAGEALPLVTLLTNMRDTLIAHSQDLAAIKQKLGIPAE